MEPESVVRRWIALKKERGCLPRTLQQYRWIVRRTTGVLGRAGRTTDPGRWSEDDARFLVRRWHGDPWRLTTLAGLARFAGNPVFDRVALPRPGPTRRVRWLTVEQSRALLSVARSDPLLRIVALLGLGMGLRRIEWLRLRLSDIDLAQSRMLVRGKGRGQPKEVWMVLHPALPSALHPYLEWRDRAVRRQLRRDPLTPVPDELFVHSKDGRLAPYGEGGANAWMHQLERLLRAQGFDVKLSCHMLRRTGATLLERTLLRQAEGPRDGVYRSVQGFLRHESIATTMRYLQADPDRQRAVMELFGNSFDWGSEPRTDHDREGPVQQPREWGARVAGSREGPRHEKSPEPAERNRRVPRAHARAVRGDR